MLAENNSIMDKENNYDLFYQRYYGSNTAHMKILYF